MRRLFLKINDLPKLLKVVIYVKFKELSKFSKNNVVITQYEDKDQGDLKRDRSNSGDIHDNVVFNTEYDGDE